jgi:hypothetical protein
MNSYVAGTFGQVASPLHADCYEGEAYAAALVRRRETAGLWYSLASSGQDLESACLAKARQRFLLAEPLRCDQRPSLTRTCDVPGVGVVCARATSGELASSIPNSHQRRVV